MFSCLLLYFFWLPLICFEFQSRVVGYLLPELLLKPKLRCVVTITLWENHPLLNSWIVCLQTNSFLQIGVKVDQFGKYGNISGQTKLSQYPLIVIPDLMSHSKIPALFHSKKFRQILFIRKLVSCINTCMHSVIMDMSHWLAILPFYLLLLFWCSNHFVQVSLVK